MYGHLLHAASCWCYCYVHERALQHVGCAGAMPCTWELRCIESRATYLTLNEQLVALSFQAGSLRSKGLFSNGGCKPLLSRQNLVSPLLGCSQASC